MSRNLFGVSLSLLLCGLLTTASYGQLDGLYEFDGGGDGSSWSDALNWEQKLDPNGAPIAGDPASPPNAITSADIPLTGVSVSTVGQTALDVNIGTSAGAGGLTISAGDLAAGRDVFVGFDRTVSANSATLNVSGGDLSAGDDISIGMTSDVGDPNMPILSSGVMTVTAGTASAGDDLKIFGGGSLVVDGGTVDVGDNWTAAGNASFQIDSGSVIVRDDIRWGPSDAQGVINGGEVIVFDKVRLNDDPNSSAKLTINGGFLRSDEYGVNGTLRGLIEINNDGFYQVDNSELSKSEAETLIASGTNFITSDPGPRFLGVTLVTVPDFFGQTNVLFTQISLIPEPTSFALLAMAGFGLAIRRRS